MISRTVGMPDRALIKLKYVAGIEMTSVFAPSYWVFRGNSVYDPDYTGGGNQPAGYDTYSLLYQRYRVLASKIVIKARDAQTVDKFNVIYILPKTEVVIDTSYRNAVVEPRAKLRYLPTPDAGYPCTIKHYMKSSTVFGLTKAGYRDADYSAAITTNPAKEWYWFIGTDSVTGGVSQDVYVSVEITYYVLFYDRQAIDLD